MWPGQAILLTPRPSPFFGLHREFKLKWFIPSLIKYRRLFAEVFLASFLIQLFGLRKKWENMLASYVAAGFRSQNLGQMASQAASLAQKTRKWRR
jgi:ABC-type bacteriocin/lantibiotic exporter with double-glycine peptidase domain